MTAKTGNIEPGARWLRCDLHVHTPFDGEKKFGEDIRGAIEALKAARPQRLAEIAERFVDACRQAADGQGMDLVALTDHNSIEGYRYLKSQFDALERQARDQGLKMPAILPGVEFSVGGERPIHFLVIFAASTDAEDIHRAIAHVFGATDRFDPNTGTPRATGQSVMDFLDRLYEFCRPPSGDRELSFILLPAHVDGRQGVSREVIGAAAVPNVTVATSLWDEMKGHLRQRVITRRDWHGFQSTRRYEDLPEAFRDLLCRWAAARRSEQWDLLSNTQRDRYRERRHWPLVQCSDPHNYEAIGSSFTWLKMEVPDVEGIRLALLDPGSRLRRMSEGPPSQAHNRIKSLRIRNTDFFGEIQIPFNPCLTTLIGGRGAGKSTIIEYLRYALDRARNRDLQADEPDGTHNAVRSVLSSKNQRDYGQTKGTLLPDHRIAAELVVSARQYNIQRQASGIEVSGDADNTADQSAMLDVRSLIAPRILSQREIARIARNPASQRKELDALIETNLLRELESEKRKATERLAQFQAARKRLEMQAARLVPVSTELRKVQDQIDYLQSGGRREVLERFDGFERQRIWLKDRDEELVKLAAQVEQEAAALQKTDEIPDSQLKELTPWLVSIAERIGAARSAAATALVEQAKGLKALQQKISEEKSEQWQVEYDQARADYEALRAEMTTRGIDFAQHEKLLQRRAQLERELISLQNLGEKQDEAARKLRDTRLDLVGFHEARLAYRREQAKSLEDMDADVRLEVLPFQDRYDFERRREEWFAGAGLQERDWAILCDYVFSPGGQVPDRLFSLVEAIRKDMETAAARDGGLEESISTVASLVGDDKRLTKNFFNALARRERVRIDEIERFLPEDLVKAQVRSPDGSFKTIETGSVGEKSTAILSLLLSAGDQPILIDQPEDDLDNQYVYNVVVDLLRRRKFSRQVIIATHNANIPVNGDAELIVALGTNDRLGEVLGYGSIDQPEIKKHVGLIMEGSAEAFRLRRERYGY